MPATAGRVRMPANNRVHSSAALQTHGIWQSAIGYDPYAPTTNNNPKSKPESDSNAYDSFQGLLALARVTSASNPSETRGACRKCGRVGHLTYQCRNFLSLKNTGDDGVIKPPTMTRQQDYDSAPRNEEEEESHEDDDESLSSDSDSSIDPEIEKIIAERFGKKMSRKVELLKEKRWNWSDDKDEMKERKHRWRKNHHRHHRRGRRVPDSDSDSGSDADSNRKHKRRRSSDSDSSSDRGKKMRKHRERRSVLSSESDSTGSSLDEGDERRVRKEKKRSRGRRGL